MWNPDSGLCISHLDYADIILYGLPDSTICCLQRVQNMCAKLVLLKHKYTSTYEALKTLQWLHIRRRITFKLVTTVHKCLYGEASTYLKDLIIRPPETEGRRLRSADNTSRIIKPYTKLKTYTDRSFSVAGPHEWNLLPRMLREVKSYNTFKKQLKTHLFKQYFNR